MSDQPKPPVIWPTEPSAIEVVRVGRFSWQVYTRYPEGVLLGTELESPCMFRWTAERHARKVAGRYRTARVERRAVYRIELAIEREIGGLDD